MTNKYILFNFKIMKIVDVLDDEKKAQKAVKDGTNFAYILEQHSRLFGLIDKFVNKSEFKL